LRATAAAADHRRPDEGATTMDDLAISDRAVVSGASPWRRRVIGVAALAGIGLAALGPALWLSRVNGARAHRDPVFEAMVAAPIIAIEAEPAPAIAAVAPVALPRARRPRPTAAPVSSVTTPPVVAAPKVVAALPREAMPPPFAVVY
jgi:hypothetical protein